MEYKETELEANADPDGEDDSMDCIDRVEGKQSFRYEMSILSEFRRTRQLCDAIIRVESKEFHVHRAIMTICSPYFRALFTNSFTERREVYIPGIPANIMAVIIDYAYTRNANVTVENVERLLPVADQLHVHGLVKLCSNFLIANITPENCIGIRQFGKSYFCKPIEEAANRFLMENFPEVMSTSLEYIQLPIDTVCEILNADDLNVKNEELVFSSILRWIDFDPAERKQYISTLLKTVRLGLLSTQYFVEKVKSHPYIKDCNHCKPIVIETLKFLCDLDMDEDKDLDLNNPLAKPRVPHEILFVVGGWSGGAPTNIVETYDTRADRWIVCDTVDTGPRAYHGTATVDQMIYIIGGFDGVEYFNTVRCFNPIQKKWSEVAPMHAKRCYVSVAVLNGYIYAMGGFDNNVRQNTAERYLPSRNQWSIITPMHQQRSDANATTLDGKIYICGGFNGHECLSSSEYYDPETAQWTILPPMRNRRSGVGVISYCGNVYALGGFDGAIRLNSGEKYNPTSNKWQTIPEMYTTRSNFAIEVIDDMIFVVGGFNGVTTIFNVECYDGSTNEWYDATDMNLYRSALSACVVRNLPNTNEFIHKEKIPVNPENEDEQDDDLEKEQENES